MTKLLPFADSTDPRDTSGDLPTRVFRVTERDIHERTSLVMARTPDEAVTSAAKMVAPLAANTIHEIVECVEYRPNGTRYSGVPEDG